MNAPSDYIAASMLVSLSAVIGRGCCIRPKANDDWTVYPNLWGASIGRSAVAKSPCMKEGTEGVRLLEELSAKEYED